MAASDALFKERIFFAQETGATEKEIAKIKLDQLAAQEQIEADIANSSKL